MNKLSLRRSGAGVKRGSNTARSEIVADYCSEEIHIGCHMLGQPKREREKKIEERTRMNLSNNITFDV